VTQDLAVVILTFNSAEVIERTVNAALKVSPTIICVDSGSTDDTRQILERLGCQIHERPFKHYADQRNWSIETLGNRHAWQLHLDADEILDAAAIAAVLQAVAEPRRSDGFLLLRRTYFLGHALRYGGTSSWHLRLFRSGTGVCEDRLYDQHFICSGPSRKLRGLLHDMNIAPLTEWTARHNRWSDMEAAELLRPQDSESGARLPARLGGDPRERRRAVRGAYYKAPRYLRAWAAFFVRYVLQLGFLDGRPGFIYAFFQVLWFRMLIDAKLDVASAAEGKAPATPGRALSAARAADEVDVRAERRKEA
jgi:glycosyltransferase involved in cell wall biosynthesis